MTHRHKLSSDQHGSILIVGLSMGVLLVLCGMYVIRVGEAALVRALGQNLADAIALESAVWHAQGMNLIVMLNLVMAVLMAVFIVIRVVQLLLIAAIAILTVIAFFTAGSTTPLIEVLANALGRMVQLEARVSPKIFKALDYAQTTEQVTAAVMPYVALARPITRADGIDGEAVSISLFPSSLEKKFSTWQPFGGRTTSFPARWGTPEAIASAGKGLAAKAGMTKLVSVLNSKGASVTGDVLKNLTGSLPVQDEDMYELCARAGELMTALMLKALTFGALDQGAINKVSSIASQLFGNLDTLFCTPLNDMTSSVRDEVVDKVKEQCDKQEQDSGSEWTEKQRKECNDKGKNDKLYKNESNPSIKVARLWGIMAGPKNSPFLHVWSFVELDSKFDVDAADAMTEFRHICDGGTDAAYRGCSENSMWRPGWFAKFVPWRSVGTEIGQKYDEVLSGWLGRYLGREILAPLVEKAMRKGSRAAGGVTSNYLDRLLGNVERKGSGNIWLTRRLPGSLTSYLNNVMSGAALDSYPERLH